MEPIAKPQNVIPEEARIQSFKGLLNLRFRGDDMSIY
jgi:hypothetical protein